MIEQVKYQTAGYNETDKILCGVGRSRCGQIDDGVWLQHLDEGKATGDWVMEFKDLEDLYIRNMLERGRPYRDDIEVRVAEGTPA